MWNARLAWVFSFALSSSLFVVGCASRGTQAGAADANPAAELITFYAVPLRCPAAPEIGCGSRAKPALRHLERSTEIREAWLNRGGTQIAVIWEKPGSSRSRSRTINSLLTGWDIPATELSRDARAQAANEFASRVGWHRGDAVDQLSEEEARVIAARLVRRIQTATQLTDEKAEALRTAMANTLKERFLGLSQQPARSPEEERQTFLQKAAAYLSETELAALRDAIASGFRPLPGEQ